MENGSGEIISDRFMNFKDSSPHGNQGNDGSKQLGGHFANVGLLKDTVLPLPHILGLWRGNPYWESARMRNRDKK